MPKDRKKILVPAPKNKHRLNLVLSDEEYETGEWILENIEPRPSFSAMVRTAIEHYAAEIRREVRRAK